MMDIYVYSDESGVFDVKHNEYYVFAGLIFLSQKAMENATRLYSKAEKDIRDANYSDKSSNFELKATALKYGERGKLFRSLNNFYKFFAIVHQKDVLPRIFGDKKDKQRYLDYVYKIALKRAFEKLVTRKTINPTEVDSLNVFVDEHTTATSGCYELSEALEQEFKRGTYNAEWDKHFPPIFSKLNSVSLELCNSKVKTLVRSADIAANKAYHLAVSHKLDHLRANTHNFVTEFPEQKYSN